MQLCVDVVVVVDVDVVAVEVEAEGFSPFLFPFCRITGIGGCRGRPSPASATGPGESGWQVAQALRKNPVPWLTLPSFLQNSTRHDEQRAANYRFAGATPTISHDP